VIPSRAPIVPADAENIAAAAKAIRDGGLIAFPTETVYGLGCDATNDQAVAKVFAAKNRPKFNPLIVHVADRAAAGAVVEFNAAADKLAAAFWPGALTLVLPGGEGNVPDTLRGPEGGVAVRWTSHRGAARLVATMGSPLTSTSANRTGEPAARDAVAIAGLFKAEADRGELLVLDAGTLGASAPSTVVDCTGIVPRVVRAGAIDPGRLRSIVPALVDG